MITLPLWLLLSVSALIVVLLVVILGKLPVNRKGETEEILREEFRTSRQEATGSARSPARRSSQDAKRRQ